MAINKSEQPYTYRKKKSEQIPELVSVGFLCLHIVQPVSESLFSHVFACMVTLQTLWLLSDTWSGAAARRRGRRAPPGAEVPDETEASSEEEVEVRRGRRVSKTGERRRERR